MILLFPFFFCIIIMFKGTDFHPPQKSSTDSFWIDTSITTITPSDILNSGSNDDQRERFLEKNREAAYRCRQKKKKFVQDLEERSKVLQEKNTDLQFQITLLKEESIFLRNLLLTHGNCNCQGVVSIHLWFSFTYQLLVSNRIYTVLLKS